MDTQYTFDAQPNNYFLGRDLRVTREDGKSITLNVKDGLLAVEVKDYSTYYDMPAEARRAADALGTDRVQSIYDRQLEEYWREANETVREQGFTDLYQEGRSGGWAAFPNTKPYDMSDIIEPDTDDKPLRERFLRVAFLLVDAIHDHLQMFYEALQDAATELDEREMRLIECPNCDLKIDPQTPAQDHGEHCIVGVIAQTLLDRDHDPVGIDLTRLVAIDIWDKFGGPMVDWAADQMAIPRYGELGEGDLHDMLRKEGLDPASMSAEEIRDAYARETKRIREAS